MSTLKARLRQKERELDIARTHLQHQGHELVHAGGAALRSPQLVMSGVAIALSFALLRSPGGGRPRRRYAASSGKKRGILRWALRHLGLPLAMALLHRSGGRRRSTEAAAEEQESYDRSSTRQTRRYASAPLARSSSAFSRMPSATASRS